MAKLRCVSTPYAGNSAGVESPSASPVIVHKNKLRGGHTVRNEYKMLHETLHCMFRLLLLTNGSLALKPNY